MRINFRTKLSNSRLGHGLTLFAVFLILTVLPLGWSVSAGADTSTTGTTDKLKSYCLTEAAKVKLAKAAKDGCSDANNLKSTINVAGYYCTQMSADKKTSATSGSGSDRSNCIYSKAKEFIKKIVDAKPKTKADFARGLDQYLTETGFSLTTPAPTSNQGATGQEYKGGSVTCDPLDGTCSDCNNLDDQGNSPTDCVGCTHGACQDPAADPNISCTKNACNLITKYLNPTIDLLSVSFGLLAIISIILGGVQYAASEGDPQKVSKAKSRIVNTIFAIVAYFFMYAALQFLIPGGLFD